METIALINGINSIFHNLCYSNQMELRFEITYLASILFEKVQYILYDTSYETPHCYYNTNIIIMTYQHKNT